MTLGTNLLAKGLRAQQQLYSALGLKVLSLGEELERQTYSPETAWITECFRTSCPMCIAARPPCAPISLTDGFSHHA